VVEILSDTSEDNDTKRLPPRYARAGVPELWLLDARGDRLRFELKVLEDGEYRLARPDRKSWVHSPLLGGKVRVTRRPAHQSGWLYELERESA
jgi:Uma2 family endonuclease